MAGAFAAGIPGTGRDREPGTTSQYNSLFSVSILGGASNKTAITVDGGNVRNSIEGDTGMNFSQEVVQEFQLSSSNFDLSTGITSVGAVNIVTRTGGNDYHGSGYFFFRDHNMAAYPGLAPIRSVRTRSSRAAIRASGLADRSSRIASSSLRTTSTQTRPRSSPINPISVGQRADGEFQQSL